MAFSNVGSKWVDGNLVFFNDKDGTELLTIDAVNASIVISELTVTTLGADTLALSTQADNEADLVDVSGAVADTDLNTIIATVNALKDAIVLGGIMAGA